MTLNAQTPTQLTRIQTINVGILIREITVLTQSHQRSNSTPLIHTAVRIHCTVTPRMQSLTNNEV